MSNKHLSEKILFTIALLETESSVSLVLTLVLGMTERFRDISCFGHEYSIPTWET